MAAATFLLGAGTAARAQDPASMGPLATTEWNAGGVSAGGATIPTVVVYPTSGGPYPVVGVFHGLNGEGSDHVVLARTLASYGMVVLRPDMPCRLSGGCNHDANATMISALLEWAVARSADGSSMIAGKVDGSRRGLVGHSFGALNSHIAASRDSTIDSVVLLDPNDDTGTPGLDASSGVTAPTAQLLAQVPGSCNGAWSESAITPMLPAPKLQLTVAGSGHCDPADGADAICAFACGSGDASTNPIFRRYAVAWTACILLADASMAPWLGGAMMSSDESGGTVTGVVREGLDALPCRSGVPLPDAGPGTLDAGSPARDGGGVTTDAGGSPSLDGGSPGRDGGPVAQPDAGGGTEAGGCGCRAAGLGGTPAPLASLALALLARARRRRDAA